MDVAPDDLPQSASKVKPVMGSRLAAMSEEFE
jgi:hypothetical protein